MPARKGRHPPSATAKEPAGSREQSERRGAAPPGTAPPRGPQRLDPAGEPIYGPRDTPDLAVFRELGRPFWLAGGQATPARLAEAQQAGAVGIQVGSLFAFAEESGLTPELKREVIRAARADSLHVFTDPAASPTGFPFKVLNVPGTLAEPARYAQRPRVCDLGYLRQPYHRPDGRIGYRCPAEPVADFVRKGGNENETTGRMCLCNGLAAAVGLGQRRDSIAEPALVTAGNHLGEISALTKSEAAGYHAHNVLAHLQSAV